MNFDAHSETGTTGLGIVFMTHEFYVKFQLLRLIVNRMDERSSRLVMMGSRGFGVLCFRLAASKQLSAMATNSSSPHCISTSI